MLGKLTRVDIREIWSHETSEFSKWLSSEENLRILSDKIGIGIKLKGTEAKTGAFSADILAVEEGTERKIIIENQLEPTDHDHLGKLITYASGHDAKIIIWIVSDVREEHRKAIDWLNSNLSEDVYFFLVKIEVLKIGNSEPAPEFSIISEPNDWAKAIRATTVRGNITGAKLLQFDFWSRLREYAQGQGSRLQLRKPRAQHWYNLGIGSSRAHITLTVNTQRKLLGCELYIPSSKTVYTKLFRNRKKIESEIKGKLEWMQLKNKKASRIKITSPADLSQPNKWNQYFDWLLSTASNFTKVFPTYLR